MVIRAKQVFKTVQSMEAWAAALGHAKDMLKFVPDMVTMISLMAQRFDNLTGVMAVYGSTAKANFAVLTEAQVQVSHDITYPKNMIVYSTSNEAATMGGLKRAPQFALAAVFEGNFHDGTIPRLKDNLAQIRDGFKSAYDINFQPDQFPSVHAVLTEQLLEATTQATGWLEEMQQPFFRALKAGGLSNKEAWEWVLVIKMEFFKDIQTVRTGTALPDSSSMVMGALRATDLVKEYVRHRYIQHPKISSVLVLTSMEWEGKLVASAITALDSEKVCVGKLGGNGHHIREGTKVVEATKPNP